MPLAFGTILGGMATLLTTSNIIVSGALREAGLPSFGLLDYFPVGGPVMIAGSSLPDLCRGSSAAIQQQG